ncbi:uncharacterized protein LOC144806063 [Lissotriton helveticus]
MNIDVLSPTQYALPAESRQPYRLLTYLQLEDAETIRSNVTRWARLQVKPNRLQIVVRTEHQLKNCCFPARVIRLTRFRTAAFLLELFASLDSGVPPRTPCRRFGSLAALARITVSQDEDCRKGVSPTWKVWKAVH